jgi:glycosyltransferase involved in cell wall biosynthesis
MIAPMAARAPEITVVVPSHDRPLRLRWLLNALEEQTLAADRWEVIVCHDSSGPETDRLLTEHPLALAGVLRHVTHPPGTALPGRNRNAAWRLAQSPLVAFTDDDCRPPEEWLEKALAAARRHPGAIVQGATMPDPDEGEIGRAAPYSHSQSIQPPTLRAESCNIVYPRDVLERCGGFPEDMLVGEDTALAQIATDMGVAFVGAPEVVTRHATVELSLVRIVRGAWRWQGLPLLVRRYPRTRELFPLGLFWKRTHVWAPFAVAGLALMRRSRLASLLAVPYLIHATPSRHGQHPRGRFRAVSELPGRFAIDLSEIAALAWGSIKHRTFFL